LGAVYGLGFVEGMDRLWQLDFMRNLASGRLSEYLGEEALPLDKFIRVQGLNRMTEKYMRTIKHDELIMLENYAAGINKLVEQI
jgi:penicillin G amidase